MTSFLLEMVEKWKYPVFTLISVGLITALIFTRITRLKFFIFLVLSTAYFLIFRFPDVANHVNLIIYINIVLITGMIYAWIHHRDQATDENYYAMIQPILRASLIGVYFLAGFHKFNTDFFNLEVSCSSEMLYRILDMLQSDLLGVPVILIVIGLILGGLWTGVKKINTVFKNPILTSKVTQIVIFTLLTLGGLYFYQITFAQDYYDLLPNTILQVNIILVLAWELIASLLLFVPKLQAPILLFSWMMHACMAMIGFVDFSSLAYSLLFTFIPAHYIQIWQDNATISMGKYRIHRAHIYYGLCASTGISSVLFYRFGLDIDVRVVAGALFNLASVIFLWPLLSMIGTRAQLPPWRGISVFNQAMPKFMIGFLLLLCFYGMTPYLGLRTTGNFSMFSNLRTEGDRSNHILLGNNPLKIWEYQEDVVRFLSVSDKIININSRDIDLEENFLPVVEFKKKIYQWTKAGKAIPLSFEYKGTTYTTPDITKDLTWRTEQRNWEMMLLDFRVIQPENAGPTLCRW